MSMVFRDGFTDSFLNSYKSLAEALYSDTAEKSLNIDKKYKTKGLDFAYIKDESINAKVWISRNMDTMCINTGTISQLYAWFYSVFSDPAMFNEIGNASVEDSSKVDGSFDVSKMQIQFTGEPKDKVRWTVANITAMLAIRFIVAHELGHLMNGHVFLLKSLYGTKSVDMIPKKLRSTGFKGSEKDYALDRRALEMDADAYAVTSSIYTLDQLLTSKRDLSEPFLELLVSPLQIFELWGFAVHTIFMLFEREQGSLPEYEEKLLYLPTEARQTLNISAFIESFRYNRQGGHLQYSDDEIETVINFVKSGIGKSELFFNANESTSYNFFESALDNSEFYKFTEELRTHWSDSLRSKLEEYSRAKLYNPSKMNFL